jgi:hypothetical protein
MMARAWSDGGALGGVDAATATIALVRGGKMDEAEALAGWRGGHVVLLG